MATPEEAMEAIHARFGVHDGHRALHAKGVICSGTFTATARAAALTRAAHMQGDPIRATVRFSNGYGDPNNADYTPDVRGMAVSFHLPDGSRTDILSQTAPQFPFKDHQGFLDALPLSKPTPSALLRLPIFALRHPTALLALPTTRKALQPPASFASRPYWPFHAFKWIDADGGERWVRYTWRPTISEPDLSVGEARKRGRDYLFDELGERLARQPVRMDLEIQIAAGNDDPHDPSSVWPDDRERVTVGTLEVTAIDSNADDSIVFDPMRLTDGIEPSDDEVLRYRPAVYDASHRRRTGT
jgi:catalase